MYRVVLYLVVVMFWLPTLANADLVYSFSGQVTELETESGDPANLSPQFTIGDTFELSFRINENAVDTDSDNSRGIYPGVSNILLTYSNGYVASASAPGALDVGDGFFGGGNDTFFFTQIGLNGPPVNGLSPNLFELRLVDNLGTAFDSDVLPTSLDINDFDSATLNLFFDDPDESTAFGVITSVSVTAIPEPNSLALLGISTAMLLRIRRRKIRGR